MIFTIGSVKVHCLALLCICSLLALKIVPVVRQTLDFPPEVVERELVDLRGLTRVTLVSDRSTMQRGLLPANTQCKGFSTHGSRVLVTGAAGFIGYHVSAALAKEGVQVVGIDNFNDYYPVSLKLSRQAELERVRVQVVRGDVNDKGLLEQMFASCNFTHVIHLAAQAGVRYAAENPTAYIESNIAATVTLLEVLKSQESMPILIYASSSSVYGLTTAIPFSEDDPVDKPASLYAATKRSVELLVHVYHHLHGLSATGLRFFTVYGPYGRPDMSYMSFARNILASKPIRIFKALDNGEMARDFTYIDDIVNGVLKAMATAKPSQKGMADLRLYNLGNTQPVKVSELVHLLERYLGRKANVTYVHVPQLGEVPLTHANISRAHADLGYRPSVSLEQGVARFVDWYVSYYGINGSGLRADELSYVPS